MGTSTSTYVTLNKEFLFSDTCIARLKMEMEPVPWGHKTDISEGI